MVHVYHLLVLVRGCLTDSTQELAVRSMVSDLMSIIGEEHVISVPCEVVHVIHAGEVEEVNLSLAVGLASVSMLLIKPGHDQIVVQVVASLY
jgi:hypothetical protein